MGNFQVTQLHEDHVQVIDEKLLSEWTARTQSAAHQSTLQDLLCGLEKARATLNHKQQMHEQSPCKTSKAEMQAAARKLRKADAALQGFQRPDYFLDVRYDSIYLLQFELANGLLIMH